MKKITNLINIIIISCIFHTNCIANDIIITGKYAEYNQNTGVAKISENAQVKQNKSKLTSNQIIYDKNKNLITAVDNVIFEDKKGRKTVADKVIYNTKTKTRAAFNAKQEQNNGTYINAKKIFIYEDKNDVAIDSEYSSCKANKKTGARSWVLKSERIEVDKKTKIVMFKNTYINIYGLPVFYWPYLQYPGSNVDKFDGWLLPQIGTSSNIGTFVLNSYYKTLRDNEDIILSPVITTKSIYSFGVNYRRKTHNSFTNVQTFLTKGKDNKQKSYLFLNNKYVSKYNWETNTQIEFINDNDYLKDHVYWKKTEKDFVKNSLSTVKNKKSSSLEIKAMTYKDIRNEPTANTYIYPDLSYESQVKKQDYAINSFVKLKKVNVKDTSITNSVTTEISVSKKNITEKGLIIVPKFSLRGDMIKYDYKTPLTVNSIEYTTGNLNRITPFASIVASYPLNIHNDKLSFIAEPIAGIFISPKKENYAYIPNNDSSDYELDEYNLFSTNRYSGTDKIDTGKRVTYGLKLKKWEKNNYIEAFLGQSVNITNEKIYSDYVGNLHIKKDNYTLSSIFELDSKNYSVRKLESSASAEFDDIDINATYIKLNPRSDSGLKKTQQLNATIIKTLNKKWKLGTEFTFNFYDTEKKLSKQSLLVAYTTDCECMETTIKYTKNYSKDLSKPETTVFFQIDFKGLATVKTSDILRKIN